MAKCSAFTFALIVCRSNRDAPGLNRNASTVIIQIICPTMSDNNWRWLVVPVFNLTPQGESPAQLLLT